MILTCSSGHTFDSDASKFIGAQDAGGGEWLDLHLCPVCSTTVSGALHVDACKCSRCGDIVTGTADDPKVIACPTEGPSTVVCVGCARFLTDEQLGPALAMNRRNARWFYEGVQQTTRRRRPITVGEVLIQEG